MIKIWGRTDSSNVQKVLWCCGELGVEFERQDWGGKFGGNKDKDYLAMNPNGLVPTLKDGDFVLWESNSIMRYLNAKYGAGKLLPSSPREWPTPTGGWTGNFLRSMAPSCRCSGT